MMVVITTVTTLQLWHRTIGFLTLATLILSQQRVLAFLPPSSIPTTTSHFRFRWAIPKSTSLVPELLHYTHQLPARQAEPVLRLYQSTTASSTLTATTDYGIDMDQNAMMESDMLVTVDIHDLLVVHGPPPPSTTASTASASTTATSCSKKQGHSFGVDTPRGVLHRAFSFFLFNPKGEMLLTQRAGSKITFPSVWTNTCCSHPLWGMQPNEVDIVPEAYPQFDGIKHAAIRKVKHELGIASSDIPHADITFISRFHYWASDTLTHGPESPWGEHEVDYILFLQLDHEPGVHANSEEVSDYKYVSLEELKTMMYGDNDLLWSPWFRGIMERGGFDWWADLKGALQGKYTNPDVVFFDPPPEHIAAYNLPSHTRQTGVLHSHT